MTAEEIRNVVKIVFAPSCQPLAEVPTIQGQALSCAVIFLQEIAAQLAELNARLTPGNFEVNIYDCSFDDAKKAGQK